jgi:DNA-directed RNA polymerase subunit alpha
MTEFVLNIKRLLVRVSAPDPRRLTLKKKGKGPVTAGDFTETHEIQVVNKGSISARSPRTAPSSSARSRSAAAAAT